MWPVGGRRNTSFVPDWSVTAKVRLEAPPVINSKSSGILRSGLRVRIHSVTASALIPVGAGFIGRWGRALQAGSSLDVPRLPSGGYRLDADMRGPSVVVGLDACCYVVFGAPGHDCVHEPRRTGVDFVVAEPEAKPTVAIVGQCGVHLKLLICSGVCKLSVGGQHTLLFHAQKSIGTHYLAGLGCVLWCGPVGVRARGLLSRQCQHLGTESCEHNRGRLDLWSGHNQRCPAWLRDTCAWWTSGLS